MTSLEEYRVAIGTFITKLFSNSFLDIHFGSYSWTLEKNRGNFVKFTCVLSITLKSAIVISLLHYEDINLGPVYNIKLVVLGSFHLSDNRFGATAGVQCACNSLLALCWSKNCNCRIWQKDDLDHVLNEGDQFSKSLNTINLVSVDDLPHTAKLLTWTSILILYT